MGASPGEEMEGFTVRGHGHDYQGEVYDGRREKASRTHRICPSHHERSEIGRDVHIQPNVFDLQRPRHRVPEGLGSPRARP